MKCQGRMPMTHNTRQGGQEQWGMGPKRHSRRLGPRYVFFVCLVFFLTNQTYFFNI
jgi:hypothetical protein